MRLPTDAYPFPFAADELDFRPLLAAMIRDRLRGRDRAKLPAHFSAELPRGFATLLQTLCHAHGADTVVLSGGVFQNEMLLERPRRIFWNRKACRFGRITPFPRAMAESVWGKPRWLRWRILN